MSTKSRKLIGSLALTLFSLALAIGLCEGIFRLVLFTDILPVENLRQAWRYADESLDDDYWKLFFMFHAGSKGQRVGNLDSRYGWAPETTPENPLGLVSDTPYTRADIRNPVLFYGDSFVFGASPLPSRIPQVMDKMLPDSSVLNYGVGGFGVDQIYLRFSDTAKDFDNPLVLLGILTLDLHRTVLSIRTGQKPYYEIDGDELVLRNLPIEPSTQIYIEKNPPEIHSYFLRFVLFRMRSLLPEAWFDSWMGYDEQKQRKIDINRRLLEQLEHDSDMLERPIQVVLFYSEEEFAEVQWPEQFLKMELDRLGIAYFDTKSWLQSHMDRTGTSLDELYYIDNGHPNALGNGIISEGLVKWLSDRGLLGHL